MDKIIKIANKYKTPKFKSAKVFSLWVLPVLPAAPTFIYVVNAMLFIFFDFR